MEKATVFAVVLATLIAGHQVADHVLGQTDRQAVGKALPGWEGWRHNLEHVALYHAVLFGMLSITIQVLELPVSLWGKLAGLAFSAVTHAVIDRRWPVRWLLDHTGSAPFARLGTETPSMVGLNGMYLADQALHYGCLWVAALLVVVVSV